MNSPPPFIRAHRPSPVPLFLPALGLAAGLFAGPSPLWDWQGAAVATAALGLLAVGVVRPAIGSAAVFAVWVLLGTARAGGVSAPAEVARDGPVLVRLELVARPVGERGVVDLIGAWAGTNLREPVPHRRGRAELVAPPSALSGLGPGSVLFTLATVRAGRAGRVYVIPRGGAPLVVETRQAPSVVSRLVAGARRRVAQGLGRTAPADLYGLFAALVLGERQGLSFATREHFARTGTAHLLAISGLHVGACLLLVWALAGRVLAWLPTRWTVSGLAVRLGGPVGLVAAAMYVAVAGAPVSGQRALAMGAVVVLAALMTRRVSPWNALSAAAFCVLWVDPLALRSVGFQLSVLSVGGLIAWSHLLGDVVPAWTRTRAGRAAIALLWTGVIGTLVTGPLVAAIWGRVPIAGLWANAMAVPLLGAATVPPLLVGAFLGAVDPVLGAPFVWVASVPARLGLWVLSVLGSARAAPMLVWWPPPVAVAALYGLVAVAVALGRER